MFVFSVRVVALPCLFSVGVAFVLVCLVDFFMGVAFVLLSLVVFFHGCCICLAFSCSFISRVLHLSCFRFSRALLLSCTLFCGNCFFCLALSPFFIKGAAFVLLCLVLLCMGVAACGILSLLLRYVVVHFSMGVAWFRTLSWALLRLACVCGCVLSRGCCISVVAVSRIFTLEFLHLALFPVDTRAGERVSCRRRCFSLHSNFIYYLHDACGLAQTNPFAH